MIATTTLSEACPCNPSNNFSSMELLGCAFMVNDWNNAKAKNATMRTWKIFFMIQVCVRVICEFVDEVNKSKSQEESIPKLRNRKQVVWNYQDHIY